MGLAIRDLVSVVIVAHNNWPDLALAIGSALHQSYEPVEVIVIDNASTDETSAAVPGRFGRAIRYIRQTRNLYDGGGYNAGLQAASGEYVQFLDADDFLAPDKIERQVRAFRSNPEADIVRGSYRHFRLRPGVADWTERDLPQSSDLLATLIRGDCWAAGLLVHSVLFRRRTLERIGPWDEQIVGVDLDYFLRAAWARCRIVDCPESLCFYQVRSGQMSAITQTQRRNRLKTLEKALTYVTADPYRSAIAQRLAWLRFYDALASRQLTRVDRVARLRLALQGQTGVRSRISFAVGWCLIQCPGGSALLDARLLRFMRSAAARVLGLKPPHPTHA